MRGIRGKWVLLCVVPCAVGLAAVLCALLAPNAPATADEPEDPNWSVFAEGLTNPRNIRFGPDGLLYVAEAGVGPVPGEEPLYATCEPVDNAFTVGGPYQAGFSGRVSRIWPDGTRETVADGLPSVIDGTFFDALGPTDIAWIDGTMYVLIEGGGCSRGLPDDPAGVIRINGDGSYDYVADISTFIRTHPVANPPVSGPDGDEEPDGVPHSMLAVGNTLLVVETNHNSILEVHPQTGHIRRLYDLSVQDPAPIILMRRGDEYLLGGFDGLIQTFDHKFGPVSTAEDGFGPIVEMTFFGNELHVLETFASDTPWTPDTGRVVRRNKDGSRTVVADELNFPIGMARAGSVLYVSTDSHSLGAVEGLGRIARIDLR